MIPVTDLPPSEHIYSFVGDDGENIHIASDRLRVWCQSARLERVWVPMDRAMAEKFVTDNVISLERVRQLELDPPDQEENPVVFCSTGTFTDGNPDVVLADGHHRYYLHREDEFVLSVLVGEREWRQFRISGIRDTTKDALREMPVLRRKYW